MKEYFISGVIDAPSGLHLGFYAHTKADLKKDPLRKIAWAIIRKSHPELEFVDGLTFHVTAFNNIER